MILVISRYKEINQRLKCLLAEERKSLQMLRETYANDLKSRTELETMLRQCVEDVRKEIAHRKIQDGLTTAHADEVKLYGRDPNSISVEKFSREDRERAIELLLSQERVLSLLYAKSFPLDKEVLSGHGKNFGENSKSPNKKQSLTTNHRHNVDTFRIEDTARINEQEIALDIPVVPVNYGRPDLTRNLNAQQRDHQRDKLPNIQSHPNE